MHRLTALGSKNRQKSYGPNALEPYRFYRRAHSLRGWSPWHDEHDRTGQQIDQRLVALNVAEKRPNWMRPSTSGPAPPGGDRPGRSAGLLAQEHTGEREKVVEMVPNDPAHDLEIQC